MTPAGLAAGLSHMIFHGIMKISLFFCVGAIIYKTHREYVYELKGFGKVMPVTMGCFLIGSLALVGVPGLCGFISKWNLANAAVETGNTLAFIGVLALMLSAILTAIYLFTIVIHAYFPGEGFDAAGLQGVEEANLYIKAPLIILCVAMLILGCFSGPLMTLFNSVSTGLI